MDDVTSKRLQTIIELMSYLQQNIGKILIFYIEVVGLFNRIDKFKIGMDLKKLLIARLSAILTEFFLLNEGPNEYAEVDKYIFEFKIFVIKNSELTIAEPSLLSHLKSFYNMINLIREKYKDSSLQLDPFKAYKPNF